MGTKKAELAGMTPKSDKYLAKWAKWRGDKQLAPSPKDRKAKASGLLGVVEQQTHVANFYMRQPHGMPRALKTLERVSRIISDYDGAVTPDVALAIVKLRLNIAALFSRMHRHDVALHEAQVALREADGVAQALDMVGDPAGAADTAVLACLAQQAIAAELAHLEAPEMSITDMLQNAKYTAQTFLPATHPLGKLAERTHQARTKAQSQASAAAVAEMPEAMPEMLRKTLEETRLQGSPEAPPVLGSPPGVFPGDDFSGKVLVDAQSSDIATSLPVFEFSEDQPRARPAGRRGRGPDDLQLPPIEVGADARPPGRESRPREVDFPDPPSWLTEEGSGYSPTLRGVQSPVSPVEELRALSEKIEDAKLDGEYRMSSSVPALPLLAPYAEM